MRLIISDVVQLNTVDPSRCPAIVLDDGTVKHWAELDRADVALFHREGMRLLLNYQGLGQRRGAMVLGCLQDLYPEIVSELEEVRDVAAVSGAG